MEIQVAATKNDKAHWVMKPNLNILQKIRVEPKTNKPPNLKVIISTNQGNWFLGNYSIP